MKIRPKGGDLKSLKLSPEEGFVLSRVDGPATVKELVSLTGFDEARVTEIVGRLAAEGALEVEGAGGAVGASAPPAGHAPSMSPISGIAARRAQAEEERQEQEAQADRQGSSPDLALEEEEAPQSTEDLEAPEEVAARENSERNYRQVYETKFHVMERDARIAAAQHADGTELCALCLDPDPQIIHAVVNNPKCGFDQARLIAFYHKTHAGLEILGRRNEFLVDAQVQRRLLANQLLPDSMLRRILGPKLIHEVYKIAINREYPERTRVKVREILQKKFMLGSPDERAALLIKTDGRCLILLVNCALDVRTTQMLVAKTSYTVLFIQNLARWSACPPQLLVHLLKQPVVRQNMGLRKMLLKHPNVPSETKRNFSA